MKGAGKHFPAPLHALNTHLTFDTSPHVVESTHSLENYEYYHPHSLMVGTARGVVDFVQTVGYPEDGVAGLSVQTET